jgi:hypothetical protein
LQKGYTFLQISANFCRNLRKVYLSLQKSAERGTPFCNFYRNCRKRCTSLQFLQKYKISAIPAEIAERVHLSADFCRNLRKVYLSAEICREVPLSAISTEIAGKGVPLCRFLQKSKKGVPLSADFCRNCRNLRFLQKGYPFCNFCRNLRKVHTFLQKS